MANDIRIEIVSGARKSYPELVERWQLAEELGFDKVWVTDHFITAEAPPEDMEPIYEAWTVIAGLAMATSRIRFGIMVNGNTYRNPALLAKMAATVDHISNGRLDLGIGAGWWVREHAAYGYEFPSARELVDRFEEALEIIRLLQEEERATFKGQYYWVDDAVFEPKPIQKPHIPLVVGAGGPRMLAVTAKYADIWNTRAVPEEAGKRSRLLDEKCREIGRDPGAIGRSIWPFPNPWESVENVKQVIADYNAEGFTDFVFSWPHDDKVEVMKEFMRSR